MAKIIHHLFLDKEKNRRIARARITSGFASLASEKSIDEINVDAILERAEVSRGTFYRCFHGIESLFQLTAKQLVNEVFDKKILDVPTASDSAMIVAAKTRLGIRLAASAPTFARLALKIKWPVRHAELKILQDMKKDVEEGIKQGRFTDMPSAIGVDLIFSTLKGTIQDMLLDTRPVDYENQAIYQMLVGLGVEVESALEISKIPLAELPLLPNTDIAGKILNLKIGRPRMASRHKEIA